jgi:hypothetical protein
LEGEEISSFTRIIIPTETSLREGFLPSKIALMYEKTTLIFSDYSTLLGYPGLNRRRKSPLIAPVLRRNYKGLGVWHGQREKNTCFEARIEKFFVDD